jgi:SAM-dependent methyltransferase
VLDDNAGERMVPETSDRFTFWEHVYRYAFASRFVAGRRVLDIACGEGYGAAALQKAGAFHVIGVDVSEDACVHALKRYGLDARPGSGEQIPLADDSVDVVVSFETIEHVRNPGRFLDECARVLAPGGRLVISTPDKQVYSGRLGTRNRHHCAEMTEEEFASALRARFHDTHFYTQRPDSAALWSPRSLVCESTPWKRVRGFGRLRRAVQRRMFPEAVNDPTAEQRASVADVILGAARSSRNLLNPHVVRPWRSWHREKSVYLVATALKHG